MTFSFPEGLAPEVYPLAWLVGSWRGPGFLGYPDIPKRAIVTEVSFDHDGGPYLQYQANSWLLDGELESLEQRVDADSLRKGEVWSSESGYWRVTPKPPNDISVLTGEGGSTGAPENEVEVLLADPSGYVSVYLGRAQGPRIELATDVVARTNMGAEVTAASRIYGLVQSELFWAWDVAAFGHELQSYASGRLQRLS
ncbi:FABP family protein [Pseudactinotalea suaedae]|uniref:FABP family protein n=1 Tax=Pseudactinotalea suaedae TaxID=1524924 RepID=UPI0012E2FDA6|nr:FABP family protein [Pseudactinotalea suaedae]